MIVAVSISVLIVVPIVFDKYVIVSKVTGTITITIVILIVKSDSRNIVIFIDSLYNNIDRCASARRSARGSFLFPHYSFPAPLLRPAPSVTICSCRGRAHVNLLHKLHYHCPAL